MEWRQKTTFSCAEAFNEARRWIEEVTGKSFGCKDFRAALENGVLLCNLINQLKPGIIKRVNRLSTPIAGLDNVSVFLKACDKLGLNESQLFHPGDLQDLSTRVTLRRDESSRRLKNVLITVYWLGRKAHLDMFYNGPQLNFKAFEGLLGLALSKVLDESSCVFSKSEESRRPLSYTRENSVDSVESVESRPARNNSEGCGSDAEAEQVFRMQTARQSPQQTKGYIPTPLLRRRCGGKESESACSSPFSSKDAQSSDLVVDEELFLQALCDEDSGDDDAEADPICDDLYTRRIRLTLHQTSTNINFDRFLPKYWTPEEDLHVRTIYLGSRKRPWYRKLLRARSKSLSDIPRASPVCKVSEGSASFDKSEDKNKDSEAQWQDDLTKWKNRRRSTKLDRRGKSLDREHVINQMTNGSVFHSENETRDQLSLPKQTSSPHFSSSSPPSKSSTTLRTSLRGRLDRSCAVEDPHSPVSPAGQMSGIVPASESNLLMEENLCPFLASNADSGHNKLTFYMKPKSPTDAGRRVCVSDNRHSSEVESGGASLDADAEQTGALCANRRKSGMWSNSASLPRGYRRSEGSSRLSSVITARPFITRVSSLPRLFNGDDNQCLNSDPGGAHYHTTGSLFQRQNGGSHLKGLCQANQLKENGLIHEEISMSLDRSFGNNHQNYIQAQQPAETCSKLEPGNFKIRDSPSDVNTEQVCQCDMRVSLSLKPNSRPDFGFHTHWDSTGARIKFVQRGSPAELCQLRVDDEIVAVDGISVKYLSCNQWEEKLTSALRAGSLSMDIRRYGEKDWSNSEEIRQTRMTLNLTAAAPVLISLHDHHSPATAVTEDAVAQSSQQVSYLSHCLSTSECIISISWGMLVTPNCFFIIGGSESAISDLQVPSLSPSSSSWSWNHEKDRRRQEKWQEEQERLLQEQYRRDQQRLEAEWQKAQRNAGDEFQNTPSPVEVTSGGDATDACLHVNGLMINAIKEESSPDGNQPQDGGFKQVTTENKAEQDWAKSLSTSALASHPRQPRGDDRQRKGVSVSNAEQERKQILEEMKKRTQLLTDNSWIRQRSSSFYKEPIFLGVPLKRYESLDNIDSMSRPVASTTFSYQRPHSAAGGFCAPSRNSSSRYSTGAILPPAAASMERCQSRTVSGRRCCGVCERDLCSGAAVLVEALDLCFHIDCFQCVGCNRPLRRTETGIQVRIRHRKPYCEPCYFQRKCSSIRSEAPE
ncbi:LOW QUALITY PROTEIN: LIM domain only protein 7-like [Neosynchiropus ocellatus]